MSETKVFCEDCVYLETDRRTNSWVCSHIKNLGTWQSKKEPRYTPSYLNLGNDCTWFNEIKIGPAESED